MHPLTLFSTQIVDLATLTGACVVALGHDVGGMDLARAFNACRGILFTLDDHVSTSFSQLNHAVRS